MHVPHRFLDRYEEQELWTPFAYASHLHYPGRPARAICTFTALCSLSVIMVRAGLHVTFETDFGSGQDHHADLRGQGIA
jgi:hypothetical protein